MRYWEIRVLDRVVLVKAVGPHTAVHRAFRGLNYDSGAPKHFEIGKMEKITIEQITKKQYERRVGKSI